MPLVRVENVKKIYRTNGIPFPALGGVSFAVEKGEFLSLAGPSGSGKTTMLNLIGCLDKPSEGSIFLDEIDLSANDGSGLVGRVSRQTHLDTETATSAHDAEEMLD